MIKNYSREEWRKKKPLEESTQPRWSGARKKPQKEKRFPQGPRRRNHAAEQARERAFPTGATTPYWAPLRTGQTGKTKNHVDVKNGITRKASPCETRVLTHKRRVNAGSFGHASSWAAPDSCAWRLMWRDRKG